MNRNINQVTEYKKNIKLYVFAISSWNLKYNIIKRVNKSNYAGANAIRESPGSLDRVFLQES